MRFLSECCSCIYLYGLYVIFYASSFGVMLMNDILVVIGVRGGGGGTRRRLGGFGRIARFDIRRCPALQALTSFNNVWKQTYTAISKHVSRCGEGSCVVVAH